MKFSITGFLLITFSLMFSQQEMFKINGKIVDETDNQVIPYATITLLNQRDNKITYGALADEKGNFEIEITKGKYKITIEAFEYNIITLEKLLLNAQDIGEIKLQAKQNTKQLQEVTVQGQKPVYRLELDKKVYDVSQDLTTKGASLSDVLQNVPSVQVDADGSVTMRGNSNVKFLIDGKPSGMLGISSSSDALKQIPADQIERIEIITNPSSKYDAEGSAGILNIIMKKGKKAGFNASIETFAGYFPNYGTNINVNWKKNKIGFFLNGGFNYSKPEGKSSFITKYYDDNGNITNSSSQDGKRERENRNFSLGTGFNYDFNDKNSILTSFNLRKSNGGNLNTTNYNDFTVSTNLYEFSQRIENQDQDEYSLQGDINFQHLFNTKGKKLNLSFNAQKSKEDNNSLINEYLLPQYTTTELNKTNNIQNQQRFITKIDFENPYKEGANYEFGLQYVATLLQNDFSVEKFENDVWTYLTNFTDDTEYNEKIAAAYIQYGNKVNKFSYQLGLRAENSNIEVISNRSQTEVNKNYTDLFPSAFISYNFNDNNQLQINVTRRINRPSGRFLIPFQTYSDDRNTFQGNQNINPAYTWATELGYSTKIGKLTLTPTLFNRYTQDSWEMFVTQQTVDGQDIFVTTPANIDYNNSFGGEIGFIYNPYKWWRMFGEVSFFGYEQAGTQFGISQDKSGTSYNFRYNTTFKLPGKIDFQIQNNYSGPQESAQNKRKAMYIMNIGLSKDLIKDKATLTLNVQDVFNTRMREVETFGDGFYRNMEMQWRQRQINLSFIYRFNQKKKEERKRERNENGGEQEMPF